MPVMCSVSLEKIGSGLDPMDNKNGLQHGGAKKNYYWSPTTRCLEECVSDDSHA